MKRLITKIQKLQAKYGFNSITDLYENCPPIEFIKDDIEYIVTDFYEDEICCNNDWITFGYNELPRETLEQILEAFEQTIIENKKYESVQYYSNI